ncbi:uncharacterized protein TRIVIDRAFT_69347 [Trichoderma virens Gv29-8]|uniref:Zn(2)-C6 fungal-type domain-containing protein n=1 Tax=Hypocrea virens (strain Gv29-8 / FGSC 10586) TaxID=413071 RepID=G9MXN3_HYPVG|nr:uncharacterized protein TRIVIDRAFT_69347 [Trichoderma virens Gv29-8]EHK20645.1 hypothetical protein TRIVIDRAFT_69347 [Trichoderma virens Gv29-8]
MERPAPRAVDQAPPTFLSFCTICQKPFTQEYSFSRHVSYCRRANAKRKNRPRACLGCHTSKIKCSLAKPQCSRCQAQGLDCTYDRPMRRPLTVDASIIDGQQSNHTSADNLPPSEPHIIETFHSATTPLANEISAFNTTREVDECAPSCPSGSKLTSSATIPSAGQPIVESVPLTAYRSDLLDSSSSMALENIHPGSLSSNFAVDQLTHAIHAFPQMMMRRQTFPPFIHAHWHMPEMPETLANCMSIAQIYATRTPETRPFLWRMIGAELQRFQGEAQSASVYSLQHFLQAIMQFIIMAITDQDTIALSWAPKLIQTFHILCTRTRSLLGGNCFTYSGESIPDATWEEWIFAETRRRIICLWFFMSRIISPSAGSSFMRAYPLSGD